MSTGISTHVLDTSTGRPAAGVAVALQVRSDGDWATLGTARTDGDGRATGLAGPGGAARGRHRLVFTTGPYLGREGEPPPFYDEVIVQFAVAGEDHLHIPLLLSPFGYTTYRGS